VKCGPLIDHVDSNDDSAVKLSEDEEELAEFTTSWGAV
jgi:hypothetical protein